MNTVTEKETEDERPVFYDMTGRREGGGRRLNGASRKYQEKPPRESVVIIHALVKVIYRAEGDARTAVGREEV